MVSRAQKGGGVVTTLTPVSNGPAYDMGTSGLYGWFGPGQPPAPHAPEAKGRAFDYPHGVNQNVSVRHGEPIGHGHLRAFADRYDLLRLVIETRKDAMERLGWVIQLKDNHEKLTPQKRNKIKELTKFFRKPDGEHRWNTWLRMVLEELFVIDAVTIHPRKTRGNKLLGLDLVDGSTIRRLLDYNGRTPRGKYDVAYAQVLKGMPVGYFRKDELIYMPRNTRVHKMYGFGQVEQILMTINIALRRQVFQLNFFSEGNVPAALIGVPEQWTPDQIREFQEWFDAMLSGNLAQRSKAKFVPSAVGKTYVPTQETELFGQAEEWLARVICYAFSVSPQPFMQMMNRATADTAQQEAAATGLAPIQNYIKGIVDTVLEEHLDADDYEFVWRGDDELDPKKRQEISSGYFRDGALTLNEMRIDMGREPYDNPIFDQPMAITSNGIAPLIGPGSELQGNQEEVREPVVDKALEEVYEKLVKGDEQGLIEVLDNLGKELEDE